MEIAVVCFAGVMVIGLLFLAGVYNGKKSIQ
jgi:hypothetical protein